MNDNKFKALTFSYDDGALQDVRLIEIFNKYRLKATFNLNSETLGKTMHNGRPMKSPTVKPSDVKFIYEGHEVASHTLTHPNLTKIADEYEIIRQVEQDRLNLSELVKYEIQGFAYPGGGVNCDDRVANIIRNGTGVAYCRTNVSNGSFEVQNDLYKYAPTFYHCESFDKLLDLGRAFVEMKSDTPQIFCVWGHSYELDDADGWDMMEEFCKITSEREDIFYGTNRDVLLEKGNWI